MESQRVAIRPDRPQLRLEAGSIRGPLWIEFGAHAYPGAAWDDLPVSTLIAWLRAAPALRKPTVRQVRFEFRGGPRAFRLATDDQQTWELHAFRHANLVGHEFQGPIDKEQFLAELRRAAAVLSATCRAEGLNTNDVRALEAVIRESGH